MEIKIGIANIPELHIETEQSAADIEAALVTALAEGGLFALDGQKGRRLLIPAERIGYIDLSQEQPRPVGFGTLAE